MGYIFAAGILIGIAIGVSVAIFILVRIESRVVGELQIYNDPTDKQEYMFCNLDKDIKYIKNQKSVIFEVTDKTERE